LKGTLMQKELLVKSTSNNRKYRPYSSMLPVILATVVALFVLSSFTQISLVSGAYSGHSAALAASSGQCNVTSNGQEEKYIYTYAINANNHQQAYAITGATVFKNIVGTSDKVYLFVYIHPATTFSVSTAGETKSCSTMLSTRTDNIYWDASNGVGGRNFATTGGDLVPDNGQMLFDQYVNVNANPGQAPINLASTNGPSCSVDTSGQNRNSVYMLFIDDSNKQHAYLIAGSSLAQFSVGGAQSTSFYVYLSSSEVGAGTSPSSGSCSMSLSHALTAFEWAVRAPPSSNYRIYGTLGGACPQPGSGTVAGLVDQYVNSKYQF
jgi:hypothetical protein